MSSQEILKKYWGYDAFRPLQEEIVNSVLNGSDTLALLPTGGGKSICFQVPAMLLDGICIVVSPLIALMKDQVENLSKKNIPALMIYSGMTFKQVNNVLQLAVNGNFKFLYVSPERLETKLFQEYLPNLKIGLLAIDESHCISQWGYDFRPPYLQIASIREQIPEVPVIALTASATKIVQEDICGKLKMKNPVLFQKSFKRSNLSYSAYEVESKISKAVEIVQAVKGSAIIYCKSRRRTKEVCDLLSYYNISADFYHAGISNDERNEKQQKWIDNQIRVMVCTNAFGMGIDKPDVRIVIHYDIPDCLENYYQEAGRAGRDEQKAFAVLLYQSPDLEQLVKNIDIKYPSEEAIKNVYTGICNYLQIGAGDGLQQYYEFDVQDFCRKFNQEPLLVHNSLKVLEQEEKLVFSESVFLPSTVQVLADRTTLKEIENSGHVQDLLVKHLLRNYSGVMDNSTIISEKNIAFLLKWDVKDVKKHLEILHKKRVIEYEPTKENPQIYFLQERITANNFSINTVRYHQRKSFFESKVKSMIQFTVGKTACRSVLISTYFNANDKEECGVCDNCLEQKRKLTISAVDQKLMNEIMELLYVEKSIPLNTVNQKLIGSKSVTVIQNAINMLIAEEKIKLENEKLVLA